MCNLINISDISNVSERPGGKALFDEAWEIARDYLVLLYRWSSLGKFREVFTQWYFEYDFKNGKMLNDEEIAGCLLVDLAKLSLNLGYSLKADDKASMVMFVLCSQIYGDHWCRFISFRRCARKAALREKRTGKYRALEQKAAARPDTLLFYEILARFDLEDREEFKKITRRYFRFLVVNGVADNVKAGDSSRQLEGYFNEERGLTFKGYVPYRLIHPSYGPEQSATGQEVSDTDRIVNSIDTVRDIYVAKQVNDWFDSNKGL